MTAKSGSSTVLVGVVGNSVGEIWDSPAQSAYVYVQSLSIFAGSTFGGTFLVINLGRRGGVGVEGYFDSAGGCWTTRTPAMRAGLKDRSQSAYAAPAPKPVERATGHARLRKRMTDATTPTLKPIPDFTSKSAKQRSYF